MIGQGKLEPEGKKGKRLVVNKRLRKSLNELMGPDLENRRRAMDSFVRATFDVFIRCLYRHLGNEVECEDVLETVYADIWEDPSRLRNIESDKSLVTTVYLYYMRKRLRQVYRRLNRNLHLSQEGLGMLVAPEMTALESISEDELHQVLRKALGRLKARERRAVEMWMDGMSIRAIANELRTTVGAVKMLKYRTMSRLKKEMSGYCYEH